MPPDIPDKNIPDKPNYTQAVLFKLVQTRTHSTMRLAQIRKARGLNQTELAEMAGVEQPTISRLERGSKGVTLEIVYKVAAALDVPVAEIFMTDREFAEQVLVSAFRRLSADRRQGWIDMAEAVRADRAEQAG